MRSLVVISALAALGAVGAAAAPAQDGRLDRSGSRLLAEQAGDRVCLTLREPAENLVLRRCLLPARAGHLRTAYAASLCGWGTRLFAIAPPGTVKVNLGPVAVDDKPSRQRLLRIPRRLHPAGGVAFVVRRSLEGSSGVTLTAYGVRGERLAQRTLGKYPIAGCTSRP